MVRFVNVSIRSDLECSANSDDEMSLRRSKRWRDKRCGHDRHYNIHHWKGRQSRTILCTLLVPFILFYLFWKIHGSISTPNSSIKECTNDARILAMSHWRFNTSRNTSDYVRPENFTTLLEPDNICRSDLLLLIIVCSNIDNIAARQNIRNSWGNTTEFNYGKFSQIHADFQGRYLEPSQWRLQYYRDYIIGNLNRNSSCERENITVTPSIIPVSVVFFIGRREHKSFANKEAQRLLRSELKKYDDIIQENFIDNYNNLTIKSVMMLKWVTSRCLGSCAFILKCNDDVFVNVPNLLHYLLGGTIPIYKETLPMYDEKRSCPMLTETKRLNKTRNVLVGHHFDVIQPITDVTSKSYMPFYIYPADIQLSYLAGSSYLMSSDVVPQLYGTALYTPLIYLEDIFITGVCAQHMRLRPRHNPLFGLRSDSLCTFKGSITQHRINNDDMLNFYKLVNDKSIKCAPPDELANNTLWQEQQENRKQDKRTRHAKYPGRNTAKNNRNRKRQHVLS